jgi:hypothetical protein
MVSQLDEAMLNHMRHLVLIEGRPPSYLDFQSFKVNGKIYGMTHGTYRNKIWKFKKAVAIRDKIHDSTNDSTTDRDTEGLGGV